MGQTWQIGYPNPADVTATFNNGTLTFSGTGEIMDWGWGGNGELPPWYEIKDITNIIISDGITKIGCYACIDCDNATSVSIGKNVDIINCAAFWGCYSLTEIYSNNPTPPNADIGDVFWGVNLSSCKLYVPSGTQNLYAYSNWKGFDIVGFTPTIFVQESKYMRFEIDDRLLSITTDQLATWLSDLDRMYEQYVDLMSGLSPSHDGTKLSIRCLPYEDVQAWARGGGNSIIWTNDYVSGTLTAFVTDGDWSFGILHEMGHNFSGSLSDFGNGNNSYNWNEELFANFRMYLALTKIPDAMVEMGRYAGWKYNDDGEKEELPSVETKHYGAEIADYYQDDYDLKVKGDNGYYRPMDEGIAMWGLIRLGNYYQQNNDHGFWLYKQAFAKINALPYDNGMCLTEWQKFNIFLDILSDCAGRDVKETFPTGELDLIESLMNENNQAYPWQIGNPKVADVIGTFDNGTLTISGTGAMADFYYNNTSLPWYCKKDEITRVIINNGVTTIGNDAFLDCISLTSIIIPKDVTTIGEHAFQDCNSLNEIYINNPIPPSIRDEWCFFGVNTSSCKLYVPSGSENAYKSADGWKDFYILVDDKTGIINKEVGQINTFPNPVQNELFIKSELPISKVEIYSSTGALLLSDNNFSGKISVSPLLKGIYLVKVYTNNGVMVRKIAKD